MPLAALRSAAVEAGMSFRGNDCDAGSPVNATGLRGVNAGMDRTCLVFLAHAPGGRPDTAFRGLTGLHRDG